ncbi:MAG TPA: GAF domain-containing protein [Patescibacteria group bacterium]|nr:GAF domain-containing protein [Patescibacteria group bacterium]
MKGGRLSRKYIIVLVSLVAGTLLASGAVEIYSSYEENKESLVALQREKARGAAYSIESFVKEIERQLGWTTQPQLVAAAAASEQRRVDSIRLLKQLLPITELSHLDAQGLERLRVSRLAMDLIDSRIDYSKDPKFREAKAGRTYFGPVYFRKESEPYMTIAMPQSGGGVTVAEVNLKFIWEVVSQIKVGKAGLAYAIDRNGALIAHPDISLVLQKTTLANLTQVKAALTPGSPEVTIAHDPKGREVLTSHSTITPLGWVVFIEQPLEEAFEPLRASAWRTGLLVVVGIVLSVFVSALLARRLAQPIQILQASAAKIGAGELDHRIVIKTGDELETLADEFNQMTVRLRESYATLEQRVEDRTRELTESLEQQTATAEILRVISSSPTDVQPVLAAVAESASQLCGAADALIHRVDGNVMRRVAHFGAVPIVPGFDVRPLTSGTPSGRAAVERRTIHIPDILDEFARGDYAEAQALQQGAGFRTILATPLMRDEALVGVIVLRRLEVRPFTDKQVELLKTFADQAVIAIENVRLFTELQARTAELTRSVGELEALGEVGRTISSTLDLETVLATVVSRANELAGTDGGAIYEFDAATRAFRLQATDRFPEEFAAVLRTTPLVYGEGAVGRAAKTREPIQISDVTDTDAYSSSVKDALLRFGYRSLLAVPLLSEDEVVGALVVNRHAVGAFADRTVELLRTFAAQSALAIQNARLFQEIEDKSRLLEVANQHKSEFLASVSHELRTPLNAIIGFSEVMLERMFGDVNEKQEEYLNDILSSGRHLLSLINDILDLAKIEAGRMELETADFNLPQAIDNTLILVRERALRRGIALERTVDERLGEVKGDERKIKQVLLNLLSNAVKFTPEGGRIEVHAVMADGTAEISVTDTGVGIAPEDHAAVFEEFRQVGTDYARKHEGTGLGLALARKFVELHGGKIWVKSEVGQGATFTFTIPVTPWQAS